MQSLEVRRVEVNTDPSVSRVLNQDSPFTIENAYIQEATLVEEKPFRLSGISHEVTYAAVQGFVDPYGSVGFHREPTDPAVTEMYFPLVGDVVVVVENVDGEPGYTDLNTVRMQGQFTSEQLARAKFHLQEDGETPELHVFVDGAWIGLKPVVVIPPGNVHGTLAAINGHEEPRFFALKLKQASYPPLPFGGSLCAWHP